MAMNNEYIALGWPEIQEYMESSRWDEVGYDPKKDLWFVPKDMIEKHHKGMNWEQAYKAMQEGKKIKLPEWNTFWMIKPLAGTKYIVSSYKGIVEKVYQSRINMVKNREDFIIV